MNLPSPLEPVEHPFFKKYNVRVFIKRDDVIHPVVSGNKYRKLKYILEEYNRKGQYNGIISFGGAFSNHIHALAWICYREQIPCTLLIRSASGNPVQNQTVSDVLNWGARVLFVPPGEYRQREDPDYLGRLRTLFKDYWIIPEGGSHPLALRGIREGLDEVRNFREKFDSIFVPVGTGATLAGLGDGLKKGERLFGVSALKSDRFSIEVKKKWGLENRNEVQVLTQWHWGGYGKSPERLISFIQNFAGQTSIKLDPVYNGKSMFALFEYVRFGLIRPGSEVLFIHTGGLQGWRGK